MRDNVEEEANLVMKNYQQTSSEYIRVEFQMRVEDSHFSRSWDTKAFRDMFY